MDTKSNKINELKNIIYKLQLGKIKIDEVYLFGSFLKNPEYDDIDIALVSTEFSGTGFIDIKKIIETLKRYPSDFDFHPFKTRDFYEENNFLTQEILENGE